LEKTEHFNQLEKKLNIVKKIELNIVKIVFQQNMKFKIVKEQKNVFFA
jgi:hypothetical protein